MSISPVGAAGAAQVQATPAGAVKPESSEIPGAADHDGDTDAVAQAPKSTPAGGIDVKA